MKIFISIFHLSLITIDYCASVTCDMDVLTGIALYN